MSKTNNWDDKSLYDIEMEHLSHRNANGSLVPFHTPHGEEFGLASFDMNGETFKSDDTVVVGGHIGNIECVNLKEGIVGLGLSYEYDKCMANPEDWEMFSGYRCKIDGIRHATAEEVKNYEVSANLTCDAAEAADRAWKDKMANMINGRI